MTSHHPSDGRVCAPPCCPNVHDSFEVSLVDDGSNVQDAQAIQDISSKFSELNIRILKNRRSRSVATLVSVQSKAPLSYGFSTPTMSCCRTTLDLSISLLKDGQHDFAFHPCSTCPTRHIAGFILGNGLRSRKVPSLPVSNHPFFSRDFLEKNGIRWASLSAMNDWEFSNRCLIESQSWIFSSLVTAHYHVPSKSSGSIGTNLTPAKIQSQRGHQDHSTAVQSRGLRHSLLDQLRVRRHLFHLWRSALFVKR